MTKLDKITAAITVALGVVGGVAAWFDFAWIALVFGWAGGTLGGTFRIEKKCD